MILIEDNPVVVTWIDATQRDGVRREKVMYSEMYLSRRRTIGFLVVRDSKGIVLATTKDEDGEMEIIAIPSGMIEEVEELCTNTKQR
jgi:hypothetical protein